MKAFLLPVVAYCALILAPTSTARVYAQPLYFPPLIGNQWETISPAALGWNVSQIDPLFDFLNQNNTKAFIVLVDGKIVLEKYFGTFQQDSLWYWASAGKTLTSFLVGIAQQEKYLSLNDATSRWLGAGWTSPPRDRENLITVRHQLTMTSGLDDGVADPYCTEPRCLIYKADAGTRWAYHNGPYTLLDSVIQSATGQTLNQYFIAKVRNKIGMNGVFLKLGYNNVYFSTARSMARFGLLILNKGKWSQTPVLADSAYFHEMVNTSQNLNLSYGYLWWLNGKPSFMLPQTQFVFAGALNKDAPPDMFAALGKNGQLLNVVPSMNLVMVRMGEAPENVLVPTTLNNQIWQKLNLVINQPTGVGETAAKWRRWWMVRWRRELIP
jgi:CubicO group peptidase (beta-lactamase class C family)